MGLALNCNEDLLPSRGYVMYLCAIGARFVRWWFPVLTKEIQILTDGGSAVRAIRNRQIIVDLVQIAPAHPLLDHYPAPVNSLPMSQPDAR